MVISSLESVKQPPHHKGPGSVGYEEPVIHEKLWI